MPNPVSERQVPIPILVESSSNSPVKLRVKLDDNTTDDGVIPVQPDDELGMFPTTEQMVSQNFLKDMMLALRSSIHQSLTMALTSQKADIDDLGERVDRVENKMAEFSEAHKPTLKTEIEGIMSR